MNATHLIISHAGCVDGFTAAWAARIALRRKGIPVEALKGNSSFEGLVIS